MRVSGREPETVSVGANDDIDVGVVVEGTRGMTEGLVVEAPVNLCRCVWYEPICEAVLAASRILFLDETFIDRFRPARLSQRTAAT